MDENVDPHASDENPEDHIGDMIPDPWSDDAQTDWPNNVVAVI